MKTVLICLVLCASNVLSEPIMLKCRAGDSKCLTASFQGAIPKVFPGLPDLGVGSSDPLYLEKVESINPALTVKYYKVSVKGFKDCKVEDVKLSEKFVLSYDLICNLEITGDYFLNGKLLNVPVEGEGEFISTGKVLLRTETETGQVDGSDGKKHLQYKKLLKLDVQPLDTIYFRFENLFNGDKKKGDEVNKIVNENNQVVTKELGPVFFKASLEEIYKNVNVFYLSVPIEDMLITE